MAMFKKGDRVQIKAKKYTSGSSDRPKGGIPKGSTGTVAQDNNPIPYVLWDNPTYGMYAHGKGDACNCWAVPVEYLKAIKE